MEDHKLSMSVELCRVNAQNAQNCNSAIFEVMSAEFRDQGQNTCYLKYVVAFNVIEGEITAASEGINEIIHPIQTERRACLIFSKNNSHLRNI